MAGKDMTLRMVMKLAANDFARGISGIQKQLQNLGNYLKTAFAVGSVVSFGREMVKWTKDFEDAMARAKAVSNASAEGFKFMRDEALRLGATTRYTSVQVAQTLEVLTRNGLSATNATRVLADTLKLAQANAVELADAGNMITNTINMFGLGVKDAAYVTDILSATASHSATDLTSLYEAMTNAAPMAHALGINIEEVSAALGALANVGVKGPDAGTQLRQFLQRLTDPLAMKKMKKLTGFSFDEEFIKTEGLEGVLKKLQSMALSVSQLNEIFTVRSSKSIIQLMNSMDNFNSLLRTMGEASGTASRMFVEGVGSMRYELDVLRSMWQNFLIAIGDKSEGPFLGLVKFAQNFITSLRSVGGILGQLGVLVLVFQERIRKFFASMAVGVKAWANESIIASKIEKQEHIKDVYEKILANQKLSRSQKMIARERITQAKASIAAYRAEQRAAQALKATLSTMGWAALIIAAEVLITKLVAMNAEIRQANESVAKANKAAEEMEHKVDMLSKMIDKGGDSLTAAVREAKQMFSEFADAINSAYIEAGKTGNYVKLKNLLSEIASLQTKIAAAKANQELVDATLNQFGRYIQTGSMSRTSKTVERELSKQGLNSKQIENIFNQVGSYIVQSNENTNDAVNNIKNFLSSLDVEFDENQADKLIEKWVKEVTIAPYGNENRAPGTEIKSASYQKALNAYNRQQDLLTGVAKDESNLTLKTAMEEYNKAAAEAAQKYKEGTTQYREAMVAAYNNLTNSLGEMAVELRNGVDWFSKWYQAIEKKWGGSGSSSFSGDESSSGSKKKTTQDKFNDVVQDYVDELKKLDEQLKNGTVTQEHYDKAVSDAKVAAVEAVSGFDDLETRLKNLPDNLKIAGDELVSLFQEYGKLMAENIILGFREKAKELENEYENGPKDEKSTKSYNEALNKLAADTMEELMKIQDLYKIYDQLDARVRALWDYINEKKGSKDAKDAEDQRKALDKDTRIEVKKPEVQVILSPDDNSVDGMIQQVQRMMDKENFELNIQIENDTSTLDVTKDKIKDVEQAIETVQEKLENGDYDLVKDEALKRLEDLKKYLVELMKQSTSLEDKLKLSKLITRLNTDITSLSEKTLNNISSMASAFDRLKDSVKDIAEAFDVEIEMEGLEKGITVINAIIQAIESVKEVMEVFDSFQELSNKKKVKQNAEVAISNMAVAASESSKSVAAMEGTMTNVVESASATAAAAANKKQAASNYNVAASEATKAAASGTAAVAQGAESVSKTPYVGAILAIIAAGAIAAALIAAFSKVKGFANGGIVGGNSFYGDKNLIRANSGEMVLTRGDQRTLFKAIKSGNLGGGGNVEFVIRGEQLVGTLNNYKRIHR